jgi:enoyl-[acyl-carrier-protein] reductase (NADH)
MPQRKFGVIFGVANKRSVALATAQLLHEAGAHGVAMIVTGIRHFKHSRGPDARRAEVVLETLRCKL